MLELPSSASFDSSTLIASLFWGAIGTGFFIYGKKQKSAAPLFGGIGLIGISYFMADSALWMSLAGIGILVGIFLWVRNN